MEPAGFCRVVGRSSLLAVRCQLAIGDDIYLYLKGIFFLAGYLVLQLECCRDTGLFVRVDTLDGEGVFIFASDTGATEYIPNVITVVIPSAITLFFMVRFILKCPSFLLSYNVMFNAFFRPSCKICEILYYTELPDFTLV